MIKQKIMVSMVSGALVSLLISCGGRMPSTPIAATSSLGIAPFVTASFTPSVISTPFSTLPADVEQMVKRMQSGDCILPCFLGITPGKTTVVDASAILENVSGEKLGEYPHDTYTSVAYTVAPQTDYRNWFSSRLITTDDIVQSVQVIAVLGLPEDAPTASWEQMYSARGILQQLGTPDRVYVKADHVNRIRLMTIVYKDLGVTVTLASPAWSWGEGICTSHITSPFHVSMQLNDITYAATAYSGTNPDSGHSLGKPISDILGLDESAFHQQVTSDPSMCFEVP